MKHTRRITRRTPLIAAVLAVLLCASGSMARTIGRGDVVSQEFPPPRLDVLPSFHVPQSGSLDESWEFLQVLYDVDTLQSGWSSHLNAMPVSIAFTHEGRGFLAVLHTVFRTTDGGRTWRNLDPAPPPPANRPSTFLTLRAPIFLGSAVARPITRPAYQLDTLLLAAYDTDQFRGRVRVIFFAGSVILWPTVNLSTNHWLTDVYFPDSANAFAMAGLDGRIYQNDTLSNPLSWGHLNPDKVLLQSGRNDSLTFTDTWISDVAGVHNLIVAAGSHHWISRDRGRWWRITRAADSLFDNVVSFCDTVHGITGGGTISPQTSGWVHVTSDGGRTWSGRVLSTVLPIRDVEMITPEIAFASGGRYTQGAGEIWQTTDGGQSWTRTLQTNAEITVLGSRRVNGAYVDVFAAGVFPDFRGGVWRTRLFLPDTSDAVLIADPDTLDFGMVPPSRNDTMHTAIRNIGSVIDTITAIVAGGGFRVAWSVTDSVPLAPGEELPLMVIFRSDTAGQFSRLVQVMGLRSGVLEIPCYAAIGANSEPPSHPSVPTAPSLTVWPNPANAVFQVRYDLPSPARVTLHVYDVSGRLVQTLADGLRAGGQHVLSWDASGLATGIYFARPETEGFSPRTQKLLLLR
ncbi:T9SS type A sorting domain-containing protein [bacterium]|nr:T9SS type A sorting domain-containing protein [bacterium]